MPKYGPYFNENIFGCVKCSIYDLKNSISLILKAYRHLILRLFLKVMSFYVYPTACHIMGNIYGTTRIPKEGRFEEINHLKQNAEC